MAPYAGITQFRFDGSRCLLLSAQTIGLPERRHSTTLETAKQAARSDVGGQRQQLLTMKDMKSGEQKGLSRGTKEREPEARFSQRRKGRRERERLSTLKDITNREETVNA